MGNTSTKMIKEKIKISKVDLGDDKPKLSSADTTPTLPILADLAYGKSLALDRLITYLTIAAEPMVGEGILFSCLATPKLDEESWEKFITLGLKLKYHLRHQSLERDALFLQYEKLQSQLSGLKLPNQHDITLAYNVIVAIKYAKSLLELNQHLTKLMSSRMSSRASLALINVINFIRQQLPEPKEFPSITYFYPKICESAETKAPVITANPIVEPHLAQAELLEKIITCLVAVAEQDTKPLVWCNFMNYAVPLLFALIENRIAENTRINTLNALAEQCAALSGADSTAVDLVLRPLAGNPSAEGLIRHLDLILHSNKSIPHSSLLSRVIGLVRLQLPDSVPELTVSKADQPLDYRGERDRREVFAMDLETFIATPKELIPWYIAEQRLRAGLAEFNDVSAAVWSTTHTESAEIREKRQATAHRVMELAAELGSNAATISARIRGLISPPLPTDGIEGVEMTERPAHAGAGVYSNTILSSAAARDEDHSHCP